jgi:hypothetical protein
VVEHGNPLTATAARLLRCCCQPFQVTEPFTGCSSERVGRDRLLEEVAAIPGDR